MTCQVRWTLDKLYQPLFLIETVYLLWKKYLPSPPEKAHLPCIKHTEFDMDWRKKLFKKKKKKKQFSRNELWMSLEQRISLRDYLWKIISIKIFLFLIFIFIWNTISKAVILLYDSDISNAITWILFLHFEWGPRVLLSNFDWGPGVPFVNFKGVPGHTYKYEGAQCPRVLRSWCTFTPCHLLRFLIIYFVKMLIILIDVLISNW